MRSPDGFEPVVKPVPAVPDSPIHGGVARPLAVRSPFFAAPAPACQRALGVSGVG